MKFSPGILRGSIDLSTQPKFVNDGIASMKCVKWEEWSIVFVAKWETAESYRIKGKLPL